MRITIEVPDPFSSLSSTAPVPSVTTVPNTVDPGSLNQPMSGGAAPSPMEAVAAVTDAQSAGAAEQSLDDHADVRPGDRANDGGAAPA